MDDFVYVSIVGQNTHKKRKKKKKKKKQKKKKKEIIDLMDMPETNQNWSILANDGFC
jgi:hypothetical protein